jgi:hypothetical protein
VARAWRREGINENGGATKIGARPLAAPRCSQALPGRCRKGFHGDLRTDRTRTGCPRRAVVYWPRRSPTRTPVTATGSRRPADPRPLDLAAATDKKVARPADEGTKRTTAAFP